MTLGNKTYLISGATGVLGQVLSHKLARQGASLILTGTNAGRLCALESNLATSPEKLLTLTIDLTQQEQTHQAVSHAFEKFPQLDGMIHLVGGWLGGKPVVETSKEEIETMLNQHLWTTFHLSQAVTPYFRADTGGRIVIVSSPFAQSPAANGSAYALAKAAQEALIFSLANEMKDSGVTANAVLVKSIDTNGSGKGTTPEEITAAIVYLLSDSANKVNGMRLPLYL